MVSSNLASRSGSLCARSVSGLCSSSYRSWSSSFCRGHRRCSEGGSCLISLQDEEVSRLGIEQQRLTRHLLQHCYELCHGCGLCMGRGEGRRMEWLCTGRSTCLIIEVWKEVRDKREGGESAGYVMITASLFAVCRKLCLCLCCC